MSLIVDDRHHDFHGDNVRLNLAYAEQALLDLSSIMEKASVEALAEGDTAENFKTFAGTIKTFEGQLSSLGEEFDKLHTEFVAMIDELDQDIY